MREFLIKRLDNLSDSLIIQSKMTYKTKKCLSFDQVLKLLLKDNIFSVAKKILSSQRYNLPPKRGSLKVSFGEELCFLLF